MEVNERDEGLMTKQAIECKYCDAKGTIAVLNSKSFITPEGASISYSTGGYRFEKCDMCGGLGYLAIDVDKLNNINGEKTQ